VTRAIRVLLVAMAAAGLGARQQPPAFRTSVQTVVIHATVKDAGGRLVPDLGREHFQVLDNGKPAEIATFSNEIQPLTVALLLDMSASMNPGLLRVRDSTLHFIQALLPHDRVRIGTFGAEIAISPILTGDKAVLSRIAREELWPGGGTPLWNALHAGMESLQAETGRRVVLVLTDGMDSGSLGEWKGNFGEVRRRARADGFMLYAIGMEGVFHDTDRLREFNRLVDETGGGRFEASRDDDLAATFARVADELRHQYLIGFVPQLLDGREHRIEVRLTRSGLQARARTSYVAAQQ
jgi:Ca-activated chloride channel homolog